jgi:hypothetical protein
LIYKCGGIDKRTIEKFEKVRPQHLAFRLCPLAPYRKFAPRWGNLASELAPGYDWPGDDHSNHRAIMNHHRTSGALVDNYFAMQPSR